METTRKLATIRRIDSLDPIEGADKIECASIGGWKVVAQKGLYNVGDLAVYCEIDSWIPTAVAPFLTKPGHYPKVFEGVEGERLKTIKLRGQVSQGLLLPLKKTPILDTATQEEIDDIYYLSVPFSGEGFPAGVNLMVREGEDVTETLGILKWEKPLPAQLQGRVRGNFPWFIPKTDQERIQNYGKEFHAAREADARFEVTEKIDGSSMTIYLRAKTEELEEIPAFGVCSRNLELIETEENAYWATARKLDLENKMRAVVDSGMLEGTTEFAVQGELAGPGIQKNIYKLDELTFVVFDIYDITKGQYLLPDVRRALCNRFGFFHVPVIYTEARLVDFPDVQTLLASAEGPSLYNRNTEREGLVFKQIDRNFSFKAISNKFLLKHGDE